MEMILGMVFGAGTMAALWWLIDSRGGVATVEKTLVDDAKNEIKKVL